MYYWFRLHEFVFSVDITKMYRQILVHSDDKNLQRIFWYDSNRQLHIISANYSDP